MLLENRHVAIIGAGPGGLTLARLLQLEGVSVKVYERDLNRTARTQGGTLDLHWESGLKALEKAGLMDAFKSNYRAGNDRLRIIDKNATIVFDEHQEASAANFGDEWFRPEIDRGPLRDILLDALLPDTLVWDSHVLSIEKIIETWKIVFQNGNTIVADIVIGADGANSKIRHMVTDILPFYSGVTILEKNIYDAKNSAPKIYDLLKGGKIMSFGESKTITMSAKGDGSIDLYMGFKAEEGWIANSGIDFKSDQVLDWFKKEYNGWDDIWLELFENKQTSFTPRPMYCMPLDQCWEAQSNITLIGDAAHLMPPYAGEGVNMAMLDALELSKSLTSQRSNDIKYAIADYEKQMFKRFAITGRETLDNTYWMHSVDGLKKMLALFS